MIAIIGAGISGLSLGEFLQRKKQPFMLFEAGDHPGGTLRTLRMGPYLLETGPNTVVLNSDTGPFLDELGLSNEIIPPASQSRKRFVLRKGKYKPLPSGLLSLIAGNFFSPKARVRVLRELFLAGSEVEKETVDAFFRRRFGAEVADFAIAPFISGTFANHPSNLLMEAAFPQFLDYERSAGSVIRGMMRSQKRSPYKGIFSFPGGLGRLPEVLASRLGDALQTGTQLQEILPVEGGYKLKFPGKEVFAGKVVFTQPAWQLSDLLQSLFPDFAASLRQIPYPPVTLVFSAYKKSDCRHSLDGFGVLHNHLEPSETLGTLFNSSLFPGRCPEDEVLLTTFVGGGAYPEKALLPDDAIAASVYSDHKRFLGVKNLPVFRHIVRWNSGIPQYDASVLAARTYLPALQAQALYFCGNWTGGISVPACIGRAKTISESL
jgi:oxygen-dependent protoporphyrinogen oxidase